MRVASAAVGILSLLLLLTWLLLNGLNLNSARFDRELGALDDFSRSERALNREVLTARAGLSRNYDALVRLTNAFDGALQRLREAAGPHSEEGPAVEALAARLRQQEALIEQFKSKHALLRNSFAYFEIITNRLAASHDKATAAAATTLAAAMLRLTLDTSQAAAREVQKRLDELAAQPSGTDDADAIRAVLAHGGMLHDLLPATDSILRALIGAASAREQDIVRSLIVKRQLAARASARHYRVLLYAISVTLLVALGYLGLQLRARAIALRRRAAFEHLIAGISTRFINSSRHDIAAHVEDALERLAGVVGADRAYFVVPAQPKQVFRWSRTGVAFPQGWPERALALAAVAPYGREGAIHISHIGKPQLDGIARGLHPADLEGWLCIPGAAGQGSSAILGFDALRPGPLSQWTEFGLARMAFDAIANAVGRVTLEQDKQRLEASLQQARRIETIGAFATGIAHNFNNIVGAILGYAEMLHSQVEARGRAGANVAEIQRAGERARELVGQILKFGRRGDDDREDVCVRTLIAETHSLLAASLPSHVGVVIHETSGLTVVSAKPAQLQQVVLNICNNAAQAMEAPGAIGIDITVRTIAHPRRVGHRELDAGRFVIMSISDPGRGMDEATRERIFEPFFTTHADGNGLGLATAREIVSEYGGAMDVTSAVGSGSRFDIWLPSIERDEPRAGQRAPRVVRRGRGETVLVLEGDHARLLRHEEILAALGYEPVGFCRPVDAAAACRPSEVRFDAVLVCHHSGTGAALDFAATLHDRMPGLPIILATPSTRDLGVARLTASGITELVPYPLASSELAGALSRCLLTSSGARLNT